MDLRKVQSLLGTIDSAAGQMHAQEPRLLDFVRTIKEATDQIREELSPPDDADDQPRTRDEISPREWAEYEWHDITAFGDRQRKYMRGLKR